jgi:hypothetical protein
LVDLIEFKNQYPGQNTIVINAHAVWYVSQGFNPVNIEATLYKGGTMILEDYKFYNNTYTAAYGALSPSATVTIETTACVEGDNITSLQYNLITYQGQFI